LFTSSGNVLADFKQRVEGRGPAGASLGQYTGGVYDVETFALVFFAAVLLVTCAFVMLLQASSETIKK